MNKKNNNKIKKEKRNLKSSLLNSRNPSGVYEEVFATNGDKATPPFTYTDGWDPSYESTSFPLRTTFNFMLNRHDAAIVDINQMGANLQWDTALTYQQYAQVVGSDGNSYRALVSNQGIDPISDGGTNWELLPTASDISSLQSAVSTLQTEVSLLQTYAPKAFVRFDSSGNILGTSLNIASVNVVIPGGGQYINIVMQTPMSNNQYRVICSPAGPTLGSPVTNNPSQFLSPHIVNSSQFYLVASSTFSTPTQFISIIPSQGGIAAVYDF